jgi:hypothetical protein
MAKGYRRGCLLLQSVLVLHELYTVDVAIPLEPRVSSELVPEPVRVPVHTCLCEYRYIY